MGREETFLPHKEGSGRRNDDKRRPDARTPTGGGGADAWATDTAGAAGSSAPGNGTSEVHTCEETGREAGMAGGSPVGGGKGCGRGLNHQEAFLW